MCGLSSQRYWPMGSSPPLSVAVRTFVRTLFLCADQPDERTQLHFMNCIPLSSLSPDLDCVTTMFTYSSFSASDEELDASTLSPEGSSGSADTGGIQANKAASSKRTRKEDNDDQRPRQRRKLEPLSVSADQITHLACPFAKHDPLRHRRCFKYKMDQISRLKYTTLPVNRALIANICEQATPFQSSPGPYPLHPLLPDIQF